MIKKMYVVTVSRAFSANGQLADAFGYCLGVFSKKKAAFEMLKTGVDSFVDELKSDLSPADAEILVPTIRVRDNLDDGWNMIVEYTALDDTSVELFYRVEELNVEVD